MGWLFSYGYSRRDLIEELTKNWEDERQQSRCLHYCCRGNVLWSVWERTFTDGSPPKRWINCAIMAPHKGFGWGYKDMEEAMGPCYYSCPLSYLDMVPEENPQWRKAVREYAQKRKARSSSLRRDLQCISTHV